MWTFFYWLSIGSCDSLSAYIDMCTAANSNYIVSGPSTYPTTHTGTKLILTLVPVPTFIPVYNNCDTIPVQILILW